MKLTRNVVLVAMVLMENPRDSHWGYAIGKKAGLRSGALYPVLRRMLDEGWLADEWEPAEKAVEENRPPRRAYRITELGLARLGALLAHAATEKRFAVLGIQPGVVR